MMAVYTAIIALVGHLDGQVRADGIIELVETRGGYALMIRAGIALDMT